MNEIAEMTDEELEALMQENVRLGFAEVVGERDGLPLYRLTDAGTRHVEELIASARSPSTGGGA